MDKSSTMSRSLKLLPTVLVAFQIGCTQTPATAPAPADTRAADEKAIRDSEVAWGNDYAAKDLDKILAHYADTASVLMPDTAIMTGKDAIRAGLKDGIADPKFSLALATSKVEVSTAGDLAYSQGTYTYTGTDPKTKKLMTEKGKYVEVYRKQPDGSWKIVEDINNADPSAKPVK
jgi:ketosteroid isomerase-like protein